MPQLPHVLDWHYTFSFGYLYDIHSHPNLHKYFFTFFKKLLKCEIE